MATSATTTFLYQPFAYQPPAPPAPPATGPYVAPAQAAAQQATAAAQTKPAGLFGSLGTALNRAYKTAESVVLDINAQLHVSTIDPTFRKKFSIPPSEGLVADWWCRSVDSANVVLQARVLLYGGHLCFVLSTPDRREASIAIPLTHVQSYSRATASQTAQSAAPPQIIPLPATAAATIKCDAVMVYTLDSRLHMFWGFGAASADAFVSAFDPTWRTAFPQVAAVAPPPPPPMYYPPPPLPPPQ
jgi:hypothetical protein